MSADARRRRIVRLALPIMGGMLSQNLLNLFDTRMVGGLGDAAVAGVGSASFLLFAVTALFMGSSAGVQALAARRIGESRPETAAEPLNAGLIGVALGAIPCSIVLAGFAPSLMGAMSRDPAVVEAGTPYLAARLVAMTAVGANYAFRGFWSAIDRPSFYMRTLVAMHVSNMVLDVLLIEGRFGFPALGTLGAGIANAVSLWGGTIVYFVLGARNARGHGFLRVLPDRATLLGVARVSLPAGAQQLFFALGMTAFVFLVGRIGTRELAATKVVIDLMLVGVLPGLGFGIAAATLVGQALGRGDADDARRWGWDVVRIACAVVALVVLPALIAPEAVLGVFLADAATRALAVPVLFLVAALLVPDTVGTVLMNALVGAGDARRALLVTTVLQWGFFLPIAWIVGVELRLGLLAVFVAQAVYRQVQSLVLAARWQGGRWRETSL